MSEPSAYQRLEAILHEILAQRKAGASTAAVEAMSEAACEIWAEVPSTHHEWPADIAALADELGFTAVLDAEPIEEDVDLQQLASQINAAIAESGGIGNVHVACSPQRIVLSGIAADEEARDQALIVAAKLAPGIEIEDAIDVA